MAASGPHLTSGSTNPLSWRQEGERALRDRSFTNGVKMKRARLIRRTGKWREEMEDLASSFLLLEAMFLLQLPRKANVLPDF